MIFRSFTLCLIVVLVAGLGFPTTLSAQGAGGGSALLPLFLKYDLCAHSGPSDTQELVRSRCASERQQITLEAQRIIEHFYPKDQLEAQRQLQLTLTSTERYAAMLARRNQPFGAEMLRYTRCLAENAFADPAYSSGQLLYGRPIAVKCRAIYEEGLAGLAETATLRRSKQRLIDLNRTFQKLYVMPGSPFGVDPPGVTVE